MSKFSYCRKCLDIRQFFDKTPMKKTSLYICDICEGELWTNIILIEKNQN